MLPVTLHSDYALWSRDLLLAHLSLSSSAADLKKLERMTGDEGYFPPQLGFDDLCDETGRPLSASLLDHAATAIQTKRGKWLIVQKWQYQDVKMICANDGRGARLWSFALDGQSDVDHLQSFVTALADSHQNPVLVVFHGELAEYRNMVTNPQNVMIANTVYRENYGLDLKMDFTLKAPSTQPSHLDLLEAESIHIIREVAAEAENPVMLYSIGKDSAVMLHLARKAFWPGIPPFPLLHVDTGWKFRAMYEFRDQVAEATGMELLVHKNPDGVKQGINPIDHGSALHTDIMKTQGLKQALDHYKFDAAFGGARRDEEKSRAKERIFLSGQPASMGSKNQRPELWSLYNTRVAKGDPCGSPLSNWTELDIWAYIYRENIPIVPLYFAAERPVVERDGTLIMVDDDRLPLSKSDKVEMQQVRFSQGAIP